MKLDQSVVAEFDFWATACETGLSFGGGCFDGHGVRVSGGECNLRPQSTSSSLSVGPGSGKDYPLRALHLGHLS
jgi:hypothetical protein